MPIVMPREPLANIVPIFTNRNPFRLVFHIAMRKWIAGWLTQPSPGFPHPLVIQDTDDVICRDTRSRAITIISAANHDAPVAALRHLIR